ncbi:hypothetical protein [Lapillicoccus jejuensis]|uniref:Transcriptional regulator, AbiEi antitoxin, Type IV TA system n=1 Tax=Lapillicoccus jejuensis TaxID=402171 RepID=A0A542E3I1_9MICO|nr:hypothetical protein [Lapillicoccus jejuensis]TQJ09902.1 hypothetical protein FB458_3018 [Lapillicoccus jejuensis]
MSAQPSRLLDTSRPFTRATAKEHGITDTDLRRGPYVQLLNGVWVHQATTRSVALRARAAQLLAPDGSVISHQTAAMIYGGTVPHESRVHLIVGPRQCRQVSGVVAHRFRARPDSQVVDGLRVTTPERTVADLAGALDLVQLVTLADRLVRRKKTTPAALQLAAAGWDGRYLTPFRRAVGFVRAGVDSPKESELRMLLVLAGFPEPTVDHRIVDPETGALLRRFELAWPALRVAVEYQGAQHRDDTDIWSADFERRDETDHRDWRLVQVTGKQLREGPEQVLRRADTARRDRGAPAQRRFRDAFRRYFPGQG